MADVERQGRQARHSTTMRAAARVGLVSYGVVHLLIGWIALQIAWSGGGDASSGGALREVAEKPFGEALLWIAAAGLAALTVWQLPDRALGLRVGDGDRRRTASDWLQRVGPSCTRRWPSRRRGSPRARAAAAATRTEEGLTARPAVGVPAGRILVAVVGVAIIAVAVSQVHRGVTDGFTHDLERRRDDRRRRDRSCWPWAVSATSARGSRSAWSACCSAGRPSRTTPTRPAASTMRSRPCGTSRSGRYLLTLVALGLASFGLFCLRLGDGTR